MSRLHPQHHMDLHKMYRHMNDRRIYTPRFGSTVVKRAIKDAHVVSDMANNHGRMVVRTLLVFVDDHKNPDRLANVVFALNDNTTMVADVNSDGHIIGMTHYPISSRKHMPREFMYEVAGLVWDSFDPQFETYHTRAYARNLTCYE